MIFKPPSNEKLLVVPGKKRYCELCGSYMKPYQVRCPRCGHKLAEEETLQEAINRLRHIFVFHEQSGVCIFYHPFTDIEIDPQLIAGFLTAITSFGEQFTEGDQTDKKSSSGLKELVYKEYRILMEQSGPCKFAILIKGANTDKLTFKISQFIKQFMLKYGYVFKNWGGSVRPFRDASQLVKLVFGITKVGEQIEDDEPIILGVD
ncbi:MAG: hypothetical protein ACTSWN_11865 [Promethearchaeota archaeon]